MTSRDYILKQQYANDSNLAARQSIYAYQQPPVALWPITLGYAELQGDERVLDVGCGNGLYLARLARLRHRGPVIGVDMSRGMLDAAAPRAPDAVLGVADAQELPFPDGAFDVVLAMHMLYHVPDRAQGIRELRRVTRAGGVVLAVTNSTAHFRELNEIVRDVAGVALPSSMLSFTLESGEPELRARFAHVERHDLGSELHLTDVQPVIDYVMSTRGFVTEQLFPSVLDGIRSRVAAIIERDGVFRITTAPGCFVCR